MKVLIIEDESRLARQLADILIAINPAIEVVAMLESVEQSVHWLQTHTQPQLIFSDIQLADGISFDIYQQVRLQCPIVFCTAFDEYLMNAFDTNAISYLLKPITAAKVKGALDKFTALQQSFQQEKAGHALQQALQQIKPAYKTSLLVNLREKIIPVQIKDIAYCYLDNTVIELCTLQQQKYFTTNSLDELEKSVNPQQFYRANRQFLINRQAVSNVERLFSRKLAVQLVVDTPEEVMVSKIKAVEFLQWLEGGE
ncbi:two component transcriptional regulator, LytTR family [Filimonas lacunae]|uniref:Two component transcriptional regulator, LytTR family n=1 Tax=Filimonas lacunae TaxID=477680 RepID=A0A173MIQ5_9BACT|nr:LytTR family DNA-binding domain-containing protein [Filimonas lacunae]BAV07485.1 two-component system response regulator [Filimonas lacunae]SIT30204.1 two component transcriptional regulator, LytTR family [Filimonas lacunae]